LGQVQAFASEFRERYGFENIVGRSQAIRDVLVRIVKIAPTDATVLITGESGTGKELVAKAIYANSRRADRPFIPVNCAAITETLLESELFGHARGAFQEPPPPAGPFEADGGVFFDRISETPPSFRPSCCARSGGRDTPTRRTRQSTSTCALSPPRTRTWSPPSPKAFPPDLYYRLNVARFQLPPLRTTRGHPTLVDFSRKYNRRCTPARASFTGCSGAGGYDYPGNIRELENMVEQAVALSGGGVIELDDIVPGKRKKEEGSSGRDLAEVVDGAQRQAIETALRDCDGSRERAADMLGISATTLWRKMTRLGISFDAR
jgi:two-component system response regulator HydG